MKVKIVNRSAWPVPAYATAQSAGMDLKADIAEPVYLGELIGVTFDVSTERIA